VNGLFLTRDEISASYAIIRHNIRTYQSAGVVQVLRSKQSAEAALESLESSQDSQDRHAGWRYFIEKTTFKPGMDPSEATHRRQNELDLRESKAIRDENPPTDSEDTQT